MAIDQTMYPVKGNLFDLGLSPSQYASGGTDLGESLSAKPVAFQHDVELLKRQKSNGFYSGARVFGTNVMLEIVLANRSAAVLNLMMQGRTVSASTMYRGFITYPFGNVIAHGSDNSSYLRCLQIRPSTATYPSLVIPRAICVAAGPVTFDQSDVLHDATVLTIVGLWCPTYNDVVGYGDMTSFPSLA